MNFQSATSSFMNPIGGAGFASARFQPGGFTPSTHPSPISLPGLSTDYPSQAEVFSTHSGGSGSARSAAQAASPSTANAAEAVSEAMVDTLSQEQPEGQEQPEAQEQPAAQEQSEAGTSAASVQLAKMLTSEFQAELPQVSAGVQPLINRIVIEVERICSKSDRIQRSGQVQSWHLTLARHRLKKCASYYQLGSRRGRVELHSHLSTMVYRHIVVGQAQLGFSGRYGIIEDFLQGFYIEVLKAFRREHQLPENYSPRTRLELAEYMAFTEHYAKRRIGLPGRRSQQLIVLRAQGFAHRQPPETTIDLELAVESARGEEAEMYSRSPMVQQVREQMVAEAIDPSDSVVRDRVIHELVDYLESQGQSDCVNYLALKLQDLSAPEIDDILGLSARQRDYLQQRFKYHVEKFARSHRWQLVHQWLGADLDQNLGMPQQQWESFLGQLSPEQQRLLQLKSQHATDHDIAKALHCTVKQVHKRWVRLLELAWNARNNAPVSN